MHAPFIFDILTFLWYNKIIKQKMGCRVAICNDCVFREKYEWSVDNLCRSKQTIKRIGTK